MKIFILSLISASHAGAGAGGALTLAQLLNNEEQKINVSERVRDHPPERNKMLLRVLFVVIAVFLLESLQGETLLWFIMIMIITPTLQPH